MAMANVKGPLRNAAVESQTNTHTMCDPHSVLIFDFDFVCFDIQLIFLYLNFHRDHTLAGRTLSRDCFIRNDPLYSPPYLDPTRLRQSLTLMIVPRRRQTLVPQTMRPHPRPLRPRTKKIVAPHAARRYAAGVRASARAVWRTRPCIVSRPARGSI